MALCTDYQQAHKVTNEGLMIRYQLVGGTTVTVTLEDGSKKNKIWWHVRRFATKSYRFVGMNENAAKACAAAKVTQYTRTKKAWGYRTDKGYEQSSAQTYQADIKAVHDDGEMWHCEISVNEDDETYVEKDVGAVLPELSTLFSINQDYDED